MSRKKTERILFKRLSITTWKLPDATSNASEEPPNKLLSYILFQLKVQIVHRRHYKNNQKRQARQLCPNKIKPLNLSLIVASAQTCRQRRRFILYFLQHHNHTHSSLLHIWQNWKPLFSHASEGTREQMYFATAKEKEIYQMILQDASIEFIRRWNSSDTYLISSVSNSEIKKLPTLATTRHAETPETWDITCAVLMLPLSVYCWVFDKHFKYYVRKTLKLCSHLITE